MPGTFISRVLPKISSSLFFSSSSVFYKCFLLDSMAAAGSTSAFMYLCVTSSRCRWLLSSQPHHPAPAFSTNIHQSCCRPSFNLSSSSPCSFTPLISSFSLSSNPTDNPHPFPHTGDRGGTHGGGGNGNGSGSGSGNRNPFNHDGDGDGGSPFGQPLFPLLLSRVEIIVVHDKKHEQKLSPALLFLLSLLACSSHSWFLPQALAEASPPPPTTGSLPYDDDNSDAAVWQVKGSKWIELFSDASSRPQDGFFAGRGGASNFQLLTPRQQVARLFSQLMLPDGYPHSVTSDYLEYSLWRGVQGVASQINCVLATQSLLYAVGLGKGAIPTVAAVNWVLKDGIGYLSKIMLAKLGRHFDVHPKGWRLFADLLENAAFGMELLTPAFPQLFVLMGAIAASSRSAASLIQASTRSCFYAGFAAQRNFAEVIAKGEAQGMVSKSIGIMLGITLANHIGSSTTLALGSFITVSVIHMFCNWKSYLSIQLRTLNPYRASLVFSEYLLTGQIPTIEEVNNEEPLFPTWPLTTAKPRSTVQSALLSPEAKNAAIQIEDRLLLGSKLSDVISSKEDASAIFDLFRDEGYILTEHNGRFCVTLKEGSTPHDMLRSLFHVNYLYWLERNVGIESGGVTSDCSPGGRLDISLDYVKREFDHVKHDGQLVGWVTDGLIARPLPNRIRLGYTVEV